MSSINSCMRCPSWVHTEARHSSGWAFGNARATVRGSGGPEGRGVALGVCALGGDLGVRP